MAGKADARRTLGQYRIELIGAAVSFWQRRYPPSSTATPFMSMAASPPL